MTRILETVDHSSALEWGIAGSALEGEIESGDLPVVKDFEDGVLLAAIDGLGHGLQASGAAQLAAATLRDHAGESVEQLVRRTHERLRRTRGVAMSVASLSISTATMTWLAVGNVEAILFRQKEGAQPFRESIVLRGGVVGHKLPPLRASTLAVTEGDTVVFATDGIRSKFSSDLNPTDPPQVNADRIVALHRKATDDALLMVVRYLGGAQ